MSSVSPLRMQVVDYSAGTRVDISLLARDVTILELTDLTKCKSVIAPIVVGGGQINSEIMRR